MCQFIAGTLFVSTAKTIAMKKHILTTALLLFIGTACFAQQSPKDRFSEGRPTKVTLNKNVVQREEMKVLGRKTEKHQYGIVPVQGRMIKPEQREEFQPKL